MDKIERQKLSLQQLFAARSEQLNICFAPGLNEGKQICGLNVDVDSVAPGLNERKQICGLKVDVDSDSDITGSSKTRETASRNTPSPTTKSSKCQTLNEVEALIFQRLAAKRDKHRESLKMLVAARIGQQQRVQNRFSCSTKQEPQPCPVYDATSRPSPVETLGFTRQSDKNESSFQKITIGDPDSVHLNPPSALDRLIARLAVDRQWYLAFLLRLGGELRIVAPELEPCLLRLHTLLDQLGTAAAAAAAAAEAADLFVSGSHHAESVPATTAPNEHVQPRHLHSPKQRPGPCGNPRRRAPSSPGIAAAAPTLLLLPPPSPPSSPPLPRPSQMSPQSPQSPAAAADAAAAAAAAAAVSPSHLSDAAAAGFLSLFAPDAASSSSRPASRPRSPAGARQPCPRAAPYPPLSDTASATKSAPPSPPPLAAGAAGPALRSPLLSPWPPSPDPSGRAPPAQSDGSPSTAGGGGGAGCSCCRGCCCGRGGCGGCSGCGWEERPRVGRDPDWRRRRRPAHSLALLLQVRRACRAAACRRAPPRCTILLGSPPSTLRVTSRSRFHFLPDDGREEERRQRLGGWQCRGGAGWRGNWVGGWKQRGNVPLSCPGEGVSLSKAG